MHMLDASFLIALVSGLAGLWGALAARYRGLRHCAKKGIDWERVSDPQGLSAFVSHLGLVLFCWQLAKAMILYFTQTGSDLRDWARLADAPLFTVLACLLVIGIHRYQDKPTPSPPDRLRDGRR